DLVVGLLELLDRDPGYRHFMLDGQTICLEDVLALRPDLEPRLRRHIEGGRIGIGPWYVLQDAFLVGGEAIVRNLAEGLRVARRFGRPMPIGYLPDAFGHIAQMPRILRGFDIDTAILWRGVGDRAPGVEWRWRALDKSEVLCVWLPGGYGNACRLPDGEAAVLEKLRADPGTIGQSGVLLWMNGVDHAPPDPRVPSLVAALGRALPDVEIVHASLETAVGRVRERLRVAELPIVDGELRRPGGEVPVLPG